MTLDYPRGANKCLAAAVLLLALPGCAGIPPAAAVMTPEIRPGVAAGYLALADIPHSAMLLPPPPAAGSQAFAADMEANKLRAQHGSPRWKQAKLDAVLSFPEAAGIFECALDVPVTESGTPHLYRLLRRTRTDAAVVSDAAKDKYARGRPFVSNGEPSCTPEKEVELARNGSYPSGHTSIGWAWALILSEVAPARSNQILARGRSYGQSRVVCNVHWNSDVVEGRSMGAAVVARLHGDPDFRADVAAARREIEGLRARGIKPARDCVAEAEALAG
ncbi:MAG: phosphatase PAP2 family protein [Pseudoxanthomonas sp.]